jgi:hypothetical protein
MTIEVYPIFLYMCIGSLHSTKFISSLLLFLAQEYIYIYVEFYVGNVIDN